MKKKIEIPASAYVAGPASEEQIRAAEEELGVKFPREYRDFLKEYGALAVHKYDIAGVFEHEDENEPPMFSHIANCSSGFKEFLEENLLPISDDGMEIYFYLDCSPEHAGRVIAMGPEIGEKVVAESFGEFLEKILKDEDPVGDL